MNVSSKSHRSLDARVGQGGEGDFGKNPHSPIRTSGEKKELPISSTSPVRPLERQKATHSQHFKPSWAFVAVVLLWSSLQSWPRGSTMADYLLFESPMGYSLFKVALQGDAVGNRLKEVQEGVNDLAKFGKMVDLSSFLPFEYVSPPQLV